jgi:hypothetical protein
MLRTKCYSAINAPLAFDPINSLHINFPTTLECFELNYIIQLILPLRVLLSTAYVQIFQQLWNASN